MNADSRDEKSRSEETEAPEPERDVIVIGSGFGGAVTACRLAQAGFKVLIIERGRRYEKGDFPNLPQDTALLPDTRRWSWAEDQGLWDVVDLGEIVSVQSAGFGGGSLVYANVHLRPPASVFDDAWPRVFADRKELDPYFDLAASMLEVSPIDAHPSFQKNVTKSAQMAAAAKGLGRTVFHPPLTIRYAEDGLNTHGVAQGKCTGCGACCSGCPQRAKNTLDLNYLAVAERYDTQVITHCEVIDLIERGKNDWEVSCFDHLEAARRNFRAKNVFVCAGTVHTTRLMAAATFLPRPEDPENDPMVKVGVGYFPGGDALGIAYDTPDAQRPSVGPVISTSMVEWSKDDPSSFFLLQDGGYPRAVDRLVGSLRASAWIDRNRFSSVSKRASAPESAKPTDATFGKTSVPPVEHRFVSALDDLLRANTAGRFHEVMPKQLRPSWVYVIARASLPLVLSSVVGETIRGGLTSRFDSKWLRLLTPTPVRRAALWLAKRAAEKALGSDESLGIRALEALVAGAHLKPADLLARILGYEGSGREDRAVFLAMGRDAALGVLHYERKTKVLTADLDLFRLTPGYTKQEALMAAMAGQLGGELRTNPAWAFLHKPVTVHNQGGCRMSDRPEMGVTDDAGKVYGLDGLYILDGALLCRPVGVNPSATIAALAERGVLKFIQQVKGANWPEGDLTVGAKEYAAQIRAAARWASTAAEGQWSLTPPAAPTVRPPSIRPLKHRDTVRGKDSPGATEPIGIQFKETMSGYYSVIDRTVLVNEHDEAQLTDAEFLKLESQGRPDWPIELALTLEVDDLSAFAENSMHPLSATGTIQMWLPGQTRKDRKPPEHKVTEGQVQLFVPPTKPYAIRGDHSARKTAQQNAIGGKKRYHAVRPGDPALKERYMRYTLKFAHDAKSYVLHGYKRIARTSTLDAWRQTSTLYVTLTMGGPATGSPAVVEGVGAVHVDLMSFLYDQLASVEATHTEDKSRQVWAIADFSTFFFGTLQRMYLPALRSLGHKMRVRHLAHHPS